MLLIAFYISHKNCVKTFLIWFINNYLKNTYPPFVEDTITKSSASRTTWGMDPLLCWHRGFYPFAFHKSLHHGFHLLPPQNPLPNIHTPSLNVDDPLLQGISTPEIFAAINSFKHYKALRPDDFHLIFFQRFWHILGSLISTFIKGIFASR